MATNVATALEIEGENHIRPVTWDEWITLPIRPQDNAVRTARGPVRVPTVIVAVNYARVPCKRPMLCARAIRERDGKRWPRRCICNRNEDAPATDSVARALRSRSFETAWLKSSGS